MRSSSGSTDVGSVSIDGPTTIKVTDAADGAADPTGVVHVLSLSQSRQELRVSSGNDAGRWYKRCLKLDPSAIR